MASFTETWTHADSPNSLIADLTWTLSFGTAWGIVGNRARIQDVANTQRAQAIVYTDTTDHIVQVTMPTLTRVGGSSYVELWCRWDGAQNGYRLIGDPLNTYIISRLVNGVSTNIYTSGIFAASGDVLKLQAVGSTIQAWVNGVILGPVMDTGVNGPRSAGIGCFLDTAGNVLELDNWSLRDYVNFDDDGDSFQIRQAA